MYDVLIHSVVLQTYEEAARAIGVDAERQMRLAGLAAAAMPGLRDVPESQFARLLELTAAVGACPDFGLRMALRLQHLLEGPLVLLMRHAPTLRDALALLERYSYAHDYDFRPMVVPVLDASRRIDLVVAGRDPHAARLPQLADFALAMLLRVLRHVLGGTQADWEVLLAHPAAGATGTWRLQFDVACRRDAHFTALRLPAADLDRPLPAGNALGLQMAIDYIESHCRRAASVSDQVRHLLGKRLGTGAIMQADVAAELGLHEKALQRRLAKEGCAYPALLDDVRRAAFLEVLHRPVRPALVQVAQMLGYSEQAALTRSCQRWFGCSPREMLRRHLAASGQARATRRRNIGEVVSGLQT
jgi:AraC-like DNA-binding protein